MRAIFHFVTLTVLMINISNSNNILEGKSIPLGIKTKKNFAVNLPMDTDDKKKKEKTGTEKSEAPLKTPDYRV